MHVSRQRRQQAPDRRLLARAVALLASATTNLRDEPDGWLDLPSEFASRPPSPKAHGALGTPSAAVARGHDAADALAALFVDGADELCAPLVRQAAPFLAQLQAHGRRFPAEHRRAVAALCALAKRDISPDGDDIRAAIEPLLRRQPRLSQELDRFFSDRHAAAW